MDSRGESSAANSNAAFVSINVVKEEPVETVQAATGGSTSKQQAQQLEVYPIHMTVDTAEESEVAECTTEHGQESEIKNALSKCVLCDKAFVTEDKPKLLECLHAACSTCINGKINDQQTTSVDAEVLPESNTIQCQLCNVISQPENLIENRFFSKFLEDDMNNTCEEEPKDIEEEKKCTNCSENAIATSWCVECEELICENCVMAHQRLKITKDHTIKSKEEIVNEENVKKVEKKPPALFCTVHPHELLSLFCQICDRLTCRDCQLSDHRDHKYKFIYEIAAETRASVKTLLNEVSYKRELLKSAMKVIEDRQVLISDKKKNLVSEITQMIIQLTNAISTRGKQLVTRLSEVCDQKQNTLNEKKVALDQLSKLTDHCIDFVKYALDKGTDMELLYSKKSVTNHLQRIKSKRADIPNPEIPVRIHLSMEKVQDLIKVISSIGAIVVDGRVYPSVTPPSEPSAPSTPLSETTEPKQLNSPAISIASESAPIAQTISILQNQPSNSVPHNSYMNQPMNIPITTHQQLTMQTQSHMVNQQQMQQQMQTPNQNYIPHYNSHNMQQRASPQGQRMPTYNVNYNGRMQPQQQQQQQMMIPQRPGLGHQQVTSSTHPHQQQMHVSAPDPQFNQNASLRGLLAHNPPAYRPNVNQVQYRYPPRYRYPINTPQRPIVPPQNYQANTSLLNNMQVRQPAPVQQPMLNVYQQQQSQQQQQAQAQIQAQGARWHIPQNVNLMTPSNYNARSPMQQQSATSPVPVNETYKITLKNQPAVTISPQAINANNIENSSVNNASIVAQNSVSVSHTVSSSMPKTPSPAPHEKTDEPQKNLDKFCQKSLKDLMMTIAKLDSNGIMVIPETQKNQLDSAQVDSSTDEGVNAMTDNSSVTSVTKDDPNEDWCAVCMDGGDAVLCCDKCPKVFHLYCHIPQLKSFPDESETWQCMLCTNVHETPQDPPGDKRSNKMSERDLKIAQRIILELYCQYEQSLPFREVVSHEMVEYHRVIKKPIALDIIRDKLKPENDNHYTDLKQVFADIRLMFKNAYTFNPAESPVYQEARSLEEFFEKLLVKWAPNHAYDDTFPAPEGEEDEEVFPPNRKYRRIITD